MKIIHSTLALICSVLLFPNDTQAQVTAFTYQGRLTSGGSAPTGLYDFQFSLWDDANSPVGSTNSVLAVPATNGLFTASLDFGAASFSTAARFLQIAVRTNGGGTFSTLTPRQPLTATPFAVTAVQLASTAVGSHTNTGFRATVSGGADNTASGTHSTVSGGARNTSSGSGATVSGGNDNVGSNTLATVGGGSANTAGGFASTIGGGGLNIATHSASVVAGGLQNHALADHSSVLGGQQNEATNSYATVGGGYRNVAGGSGSFVGGGGTPSFWTDGNRALGGVSAVVGGLANEAQSYGSSIGGGVFNLCAGLYATIPGGRANNALGDHSFAAGKQANALHHGTFVWADSSASEFISAKSNTFLVRAAGGVGLGTANPQANLHLYSTDNPTTFRIQSTGTPGFGRVEFVSNPQGDAGEWRPAFIQSLDTGGFTGGLGFYVNGTGIGNRFATNEVMRVLNGRVGIGVPLPDTALHVAGTVTATAFNPVSDRNAKEDFEAVNPREVLQKVSALPISRWKFKGDTNAAAHVGPMAQDFHAAFGLGADDEHIATVDADGVALAAIQGLNQKLEQELRARDRKIEALTELVQTLAAQLKK